MTRIYSPHQKPEKKRDGASMSRRLVVEGSHSWINRFRKPLVRYEKLKTSHEGLFMFACAFIASRKADVI
ncbi:MAG: transposase [Treponema sp.]|jgi:IS5 family transposase|nr:transposase [Treponema sp.]